MPCSILLTQQPSLFWPLILHTSSLTDSVVISFPNCSSLVPCSLLPSKLFAFSKVHLRASLAAHASRPGLSIHQTGIHQCPRSDCKKVPGDNNVNCWPNHSLYQSWHSSGTLASLPLCPESSSQSSVSVPCLGPLSPFLCFLQGSIAGAALASQRLKMIAVALTDSCLRRAQYQERA